MYLYFLFIHKAVLFLDGETYAFKKAERHVCIIHPV